MSYGILCSLQISQTVTSQQHALRSAAETYKSGSRPDLAPIFQHLLSIEKESRNQNMEIKGSWKLPAGPSVNSSTSGSNQSTGNQVSKEPKVTPTVNQPPPQTQPQPQQVSQPAPTSNQTQVWWGTLVWSINQNVPDPNSIPVNGQPQKMITQKKDVTMGLKACLPQGLIANKDKL